MFRYRPLALSLLLAACPVIANTLENDVMKLHRIERFQNLLHIPEMLARITDASDDAQPETVPDYILIQDVHRHPLVQARIAALIEQGYDRWGVRKVFLEGAFTVLDLSVFHRVPAKTRSLLVSRLVREGHLSGAELAAVTIMEREWRNPPVSPFQLFGLEEPQVYRENVQAYQQVVSLRERALQELVLIRRVQGSMKWTGPNPMVKQLDRTEALLRLKITPYEYDAFRREKALIPSSRPLDPAISAAEEFYRLAELRSQVFLKKAASFVPASLAPRILVVGGFHTALMAAKLRAEGRSFVVLSPQVGNSPEEPLYERRLNETVQTLAVAFGQTSY